MRIIITAFLISLSLMSFSTDTDIAYQAMNKALITQTRYETLQVVQDEKIKELKSEVGSLKLEGLIKDFFIVALAVLQVTR